MPWRGPTEQKPFPSLGWGILKWTYGRLPSPADESKPLVYTEEQARRIVRWYEIDPLTGEFVWLRLILEEAKGFGKSPFAASLNIVEFKGPVCFDGWDRYGEPIGVPWGTDGRPRAWIQIAAVSEDQTDNTYGALFAMLSARNGAIADDLKLDVGQTRVYDRAKPPGLECIEPVTAAAGSREGQRITNATRDETHLWTPRNGGIKLARTIGRNLTKMGGRAVDTTNAPILGEKSWAEQADPTKPDPGDLHYARRPAVEPSPDWSDDKLLSTLDHVYDHVPWIDTKRLLRDVRDPKTPWDEALRFWFNIRTPGGGRAVDPRRWDELAGPRDVPQGEYIGLGFDGSINEDETWLRGCTQDGYRFTIGRWYRPSDAPPDWKVPRLDVHEKVEWAFTYYRVGRMFCDPFKWWTEVEGWAAKYGNDSEDKPRVLTLETNQARRFAPAVDRWLTSIREGGWTHDGDPAAADHVKAAHLQKARVADLETDGRTRYVIVKGEDRKRIDGAVADILCLEAAMTMPPEPVLVVPRFIPFD